MNVRTAGVLLSAALFSCSPPVPDIPPAAPTVTRTEALRTSRAYTNLAWRGTRHNVRHGTDPDGIRIDTPDASVSGAHAGAWWKPAHGPRACRTSGEGSIPRGNSSAA